MWARRLAYCTHDVQLHFWCLCSVCLCMYINPNTQTHTPTQNHLYSIHSQKQGFITAAWLQHLAGQPLASAPVWHFFVFATEWFVCVRLVWETRCVKGLLLPGFCVCLRQCYECLMMAHIVPSQCACVCACLVCLAGGICVVLFVLKVFPRSNPEAALAEGDTHTHTQREKEKIQPSLQLSQAGKTWQTSKSSLSRRNRIKREPLQGPSEDVDERKHGLFLLSGRPPASHIFYLYNPDDKKNCFLSQMD